MTIRQGITIPKEHRREIKRLQRKGRQIAAKVERSTELARDSLRKLGYDV